MGSYLTIVNDTEEDWQCKIGPDMVALKWAMISTTVIAGAATMLGMSVYLTSIIASTGAMYDITAISMKVASYSVAVGIGATSGVGILGLALTKGVKHTLTKKQYQTIKKGEEKRFGKMTLSLWRQCECIKTTARKVQKHHRSDAKEQVIMTTVMMRPIFSGSTDGSNRNHSISWWIDQKGTTQQGIETQLKPKHKDS